MLNKQIQRYFLVCVSKFQINYAVLIKCTETSHTRTHSFIHSFIHSLQFVYHYNVHSFPIKTDILSVAYLMTFISNSDYAAAPCDRMFSDQ